MAKHVVEPIQATSTEMSCSVEVDVVEPTRPTAVIVNGGAWGDEGKGKIASREAKDAALVIRATGGANAGHTVVFNGSKLGLHLVPGGITNPQSMALIGQGVVIDPNILLNEIDELENAGVQNVEGRLKISGRAHLVFPYHKVKDQLEEKHKDNPIGTTKRGIGPAYEDKDARIGLRAYDLLLPIEKLEAKIHVATRMLNQLFNVNEISSVNVKSLAKSYHEYGKRLAPMIINADIFVEQFVKAGKKIVVEGAQAYRLDKDWGDYPDVTSSNCVTPGALIGAHLNQYDVKCVITVLKAYFSRVGEGPFPTEQPAHIENDIVLDYDEPFVGDVIREAGGEYGVSTGRPRRCGWFDAVLVKTSKRALGTDYLCINHVDTLGHLGEVLGSIKVCVKYRYQGKVIDYYPDDIGLTGEIPEPIYEVFDGGWEIPKGIRSYEELPNNAKMFIEFVEKVTETPVKFIGIGPANDDLIVREL